MIASARKTLTTRQRIVRLIAAALIAPLVTVPLATLFVLFVEAPLRTGQTDTGTLLSLYLVFSLVIAFPATWIVGIPAYFLLVYLDRDTTATFFAIGVALGLLGWLLLVGIASDNGLLEWLFAALMGVCGGTVAIAFRSIAGVGRRDGVA